MTGRWTDSARLATNMVAADTDTPSAILNLARIAAQFRARAARRTVDVLGRATIPPDDWRWIAGRVLRADCRGCAADLPDVPPPDVVAVYWAAYLEIRAMEDAARTPGTKTEQLARARAGQRAAAGAA